MAYSYATMKEKTLTDEGVNALFAIRDRAHKLIDFAGACRYEVMLKGIHISDNWLALACVDRLVEMGEIKEVVIPGVPTQWRIFVK